MPEYVFLRHYTVKARGGETYEEGQVVEMNPSTGNHFLARGAVSDDPERIRAAKAKARSAQRAPAASAPAPTAPTPTAPAPTRTAPSAPSPLLGSTQFGTAGVDIGGRTVSIADLTQGAFAKSGMSREQWNGATDQQRTLRIETEIEEQRKAATQTTESAPGAAPRSTRGR